jgi:hypothetical protein
MHHALLSAARALSFAAALLSYGVVHAVVLDDFKSGPVVVETNTTPFHRVSLEQSGLPTASVLTGSRSFDVTEGSRSGLTLLPTDNVSFEVVTSGEGSLVYRADGGLTGINTFLSYKSAPTNIAAAGENAIVLDFGSTDFGTGGGAFDLSLQSASTSSYKYFGVPSDPGPRSVAIQFSLLSGFNPGGFTGLRIGTSNGNLRGSFELLAIRTARVATGDYNADGAINAADYTVWRDSRDVFYRLTGDGDADGDVDGADFNVWRDAYTGAASSDAMSVPEPCSVLLTLFAGCSALLRPRSLFAA